MTSKLMTHRRMIKRLNKELSFYALLPYLLVNLFTCLLILNR